MEKLFGKQVGFMSREVFGAPYERNSEKISVNGSWRPSYEGWYLTSVDSIYEIPQQVWTYLATEVAEKPDLAKRFLRNFSDFRSDQGFTFPAFEIKNEPQGITTYTSDFLLGVKISTCQLGQNIAFKITDKQGRPHDEATKILLASGMIFTRPVLQNLVVRVKRVDFEGSDKHHGRHYYHYSPKKILDGLFMFVPSICETVTTEEIYRSFQDQENQGVKIGTVFDRNVFMRFVISGDESNSVERRRGISLPPEKEIMPISDSDDIGVEFVIRSNSPPYKEPGDFDHFRELEHMQRCVETIVLGIHLSTRNKDFRKGRLVT